MADTRYITLTKWQSLTATEVTLPSGRKVSSGYDALYRRNTINETSGGAPIAAWQFFGDRTATLALGNGITCTNMNNGQTASAIQSGGTYPPSWGDKTSDRLGYDGSGRLIAKRFLPSGSTTALVGFTSEYDKSSNKLFERPLHAESRANLYDSYDSMNRLLEYKRGILASGGGSILTNISLPNTDQQRAYNLDGLGNWSTTVYTPEGGSSTTESRTHNKLNEVTAFGVSPSSTSVLYDHGNNPSPHADRGNGNIVNDGTRVYAYDALNRLTTVSSTASGTPQVAAYTYDALGRRVEKVVTNGGIDGSVADTTYRYLYDGQQIVEELLFDGSSYSTLRQFIWGQYVDELVQLNVPTTITTPVSLTAGAYYPLQDLLYRTTATTDGSGTIVEAYDYDAYGNTLMYDGKGTDGLWFTDDDVATDQPMCEFLFTGRQYDPETQIFWYRARYYHPMLGRFIGRDPVGYFDSPNAYAYVKSMPTTGFDPTGTKCVPKLQLPPGQGASGVMPFSGSGGVIWSWGWSAQFIWGMSDTAVTAAVLAQIASTDWNIFGTTKSEATAGGALPITCDCDQKTDKCLILMNPSSGQEDNKGDGTTKSSAGVAITSSLNGDTAVVTIVLGFAIGSGGITTDLKLGTVTIQGDQSRSNKITLSGTWKCIKA